MSWVRRQRRLGRAAWHAGWKTKQVGKPTSTSPRFYMDTDIRAEGDRCISGRERGSEIKIRFQVLPTIWEKSGESSFRDISCDLEVSIPRLLLTICT